MVSIFGEWILDAWAIFFALILCIAYYFFIKSERSKESVVFIFSVIIFIISGLPVITSLFFGEEFIGSGEGFIIFEFVALCSLVAIIASAKPILERF